VLISRGRKALLKELRSRRGRASDRNHFAAGRGEGMNLFQCVNGNAVGGWKNQDRIVDAGFADGVGVNEIDVVACRQNRGHERGRNEPLHGCGDGDVGWSESRPRVIRRQKHRNLVRRLTLLHEITDARDVSNDCRHDGMPGIVVVKSRSRIQ
jgi:hypothetical protein